MPKIPDQSRRFKSTLLTMKNVRFLMLAVVIATGMALITTSCQDENQDLQPATSTSALDWRANQNSLVFPITAHPYGKSYAEWSTAWWDHVLSFDCTSNPLSDLTGANTGVNQTGPVFFLFGTPGGSATRTATVPAGKPILFPLVNCYWQNPCSTPLGDNPAPGQTMEEFLTEVCAFFMDDAGNFSCTLDGQSFTNLETYRATSDLWTYTGNIDLASCFDGCINGEPQPAVADGYWIMLKPLDPGTHTLHFTGGMPEFGFLVDVTYTLTVE
jgi:hypothetical protein